MKVFVYIIFILWPNMVWLTVFSKCGMCRCRSRCTVSRFKTSTTSVLLPTPEERPTKCQWPWCLASLKVYSIVWFTKVNDDGSSVIEAKELSCHPVVGCRIGQRWGRGINAINKKSCFTINASMCSRVIRAINKCKNHSDFESSTHSSLFMLRQAFIFFKTENFCHISLLSSLVLLIQLVIQCSSRCADKNLHNIRMIIHHQGRQGFLGSRPNENIFTFGSILWL